jgi:hypothetical protein
MFFYRNTFNSRPTVFVIIEIVEPLNTVEPHKKSDQLRFTYSPYFYLHGKGVSSLFQALIRLILIFLNGKFVSYIVSKFSIQKY